MCVSAGREARMDRPKAGAREMPESGRGGSRSEAKEPVVFRKYRRKTIGKKERERERK